MAYTVGALEVILRTDLAQFTSGLQTAAGAVEASGARMSRSVMSATRNVHGLESAVAGFRGGDAFRSLTVSALRADDEISRLRNTLLLLPAAIGGIGVAAGTRALTQYADTAIQVRNRIAVLTASQGERLAIEREIFEISQRTRSSFAGTAQLYSRTTQAASQLGRSQAEVSRFVETIGKTAQISGSTGQESTAAAIQLAQGLASNRLQGDELRSILENNVALAQLLARELAGGSVGRLREMGTEGLLTAQSVIDAVLRGADEVNRQFAQTQATTDNALTIINNALIRYVGQVDAALGGTQAFFDLMKTLSENLPNVAGAIGVITAALVGLGAARLRESMVRPFQEAAVASQAAQKAAKDHAKALVDQTGAARKAAQAQVETAAAVRRTSAAAPDVQLAGRDAIGNLGREQAALERLQRERAKAFTEQFRLEDRLAEKRRDVASARDAAEAKEASAIQRAMQIRENAAVAEARRLDAERAKFEKNEAGIARLREKRAEAESKAFDQARRLTLGIGSQEQVSAAFARVDRIDSVLGERRARADELSRAVRDQADALQRAQALAAQSLTVDQARVETAANLVRQRNALAEAERKVAASVGKVDIIERALVLQGGQVAKAQEGIAGSANAARAGAARAEADAQRALADATLQLSRAQAIAEGTAARTGFAVTAMAAAVGGARAIFGSLWNFLGGPWGVAITGAAVGLAALGVAQANAAAKAREHEESLARLPEVIKRVGEASAAAARGLGGQSQVNDALLRLTEARTALRATIATSLVPQIGRAVPTDDFGSFLRGAGVPIPDFDKQAGRQTPQGLAEVREALQRVVRDGILTEAQLTNIADAALRLGAEGKIAFGEALGIAKMATGLAEATKRVNELAQAANDLRAQQLGAAERLEKNVFGEQDAKRAADFAAAMVRAAETAKAADPIFKTIAETLTTGITDGAQGIDLAQRFGLTAQAQTAIQAMLASITELQTAAKTIDSAPLSDLINQFIAGQVTVVEFGDRLRALRDGDPAIERIASGLLDTARKGDEARSAVERLQATINALTGKTVNILVRIRQLVAGGGPSVASGDPDANANAGMDILARDAIAEQQREAQKRLDRARMSKIDKKRSELAEQFPGADRSTLDEIAKLETATGGGGRRRGGGSGDKKDKWTPEQRVFRELADNTRLAKAGLTGLAEETVKYARQARLAEADTEAFIDAFASGNLDAAPEKLKRIYDQLVAINSAKLARTAEFDLRQIGRTSGEQQIASQLRSAGLPDDLGSAQAAQLRFNQALSETKSLASDALKGLISDLRQGKSLTEALSNLFGRLADKLIDMALDRAISGLFAGLGGGARAGAGLFGGGSGGLLGGFIIPGILHGGGTAGVDGYDHGRAFPAAAFAAAPRFHSGFRSDEIAAVLERGERVLTEQMSGDVTKTMGGLASLAEASAEAGDSVRSSSHIEVTFRPVVTSDGQLTAFVEGVSRRAIAGAAPAIVGQSVQAVTRNFGPLSQRFARDIG